MNNLERLQSHYRMYSWIEEQAKKSKYLDEDYKRNDWDILTDLYPELLTFTENLISHIDYLVKQEQEILIPTNNQYTEELVNGILLILKHQPDARHELGISYGTFIFGSADIDMGEEDEIQLAIWKWEVYKDVIEDKNYWAYGY